MAPHVILSSLEREKRSGIDHYKFGQHKAWTMPEPDQSHAILRYVDAMGWVCLLTCEWDAESACWIPEGKSLRQSATGVGTGWRDLPEGFTLSEKMIEALESADRFEDVVSL